MPSEAIAAASCAGVVKVYATAAGEVPALKGVDVEFPADAVSAVVGPSGSGKSSLLRIVAGSDRPTAGSVRIGGVETGSLRARDLRSLRRSSVGYVFQRPADNLTAYLSVLDHLRQAASLRGRRKGWRAEAEEILGILGLAARATHLPSQLSGGEQQRAALAGRGTAFVIATHDEDVVRAAGRTYHLRHGSVEAEAKDDRKLSVIDAAGRIQLPEGWRALFPDGRAEIEQGEHEMRIKPP